MTAIKVLLFLIGVVDQIMQYAERKRLIDAATDAQIARQLSNILQRTKTAQLVAERISRADQSTIGELLADDLREAESQRQLLLDLNDHPPKHR